MPTSQYVCGLSGPLFDLRLPASASHAVTLAIGDDGQAVDVETRHFLSKPSSVKMNVTVIQEDLGLHAASAFLRLACLPLLLAAAAFFAARTYAHDLYVSIPDRALLVSALAQTARNVPAEAFASSEGSLALVLLDELSSLAVCASLAFFWAVFARDKLARNEPWERNTRYYAIEALAVSAAGAAATIRVLYSVGPLSANPFQ